jgi:hypothetical protein
MDSPYSSAPYIIYLSLSMPNYFHLFTQQPTLSKGEGGRPFCQLCGAIFVLAQGRDNVQEKELSFEPSPGALVKQTLARQGEH